ncbi:unnamed protein product [Sphagnum balticum]
MKDIVSSLLHHGAQLKNNVDDSHNLLNAVLEALCQIRSDSLTTPHLILDILLSRFPDLRIIGENLVKAVRRDSCRWARKSCLELLFEHDHLVQVPETAILTGLSPYTGVGEKLIEQLLGRYQNGTVNEEMLRMAPSVRTLRLLLQHPHVCPISLALVQDELSKKDSMQRLEMFLHYDDKLRFMAECWYGRGIACARTAKTTTETAIAALSGAGAEQKWAIMR